MTATHSAAVPIFMHWVRSPKLQRIHACVHFSDDTRRRIRGRKWRWWMMRISWEQIRGHISEGQLDDDYSVNGWATNRLERPMWWWRRDN